MSVLYATLGAATNFDWLVEQNELVTLRIPILDSNGAAFDITGWSVDARIEKGRGGSLLYQWPDDKVLADDVYVYLTLLPATTLAWSFRRGSYLVCVQHPTDATQRHRVLEGRLFVSPD